VTLFVDIGAKRIQTYLARTPSLKGRRGASALLDHDALLGVLQPDLTGTAQVNPEGKRTDGVVSLMLPDDLPAAAALADRAVSRLRAHAPAAEWEIHLAEGATYRDALKARSRAERLGHVRWQAELTGPGTLAVPAPVAEVPVVRLCSECGLDPAEHRTVDIDGQDAYHCADCARRLAVAGTRQTTPAEEGLLAEISSRRPRLAGQRPVQTFEQLAQLGAEAGRRNHLCTVFVDGNRFGELFATLEDPNIDLQTLSRAMASAMREALVEATAAVTAPDADRMPVIVHLLGGDDLLASVVADLGWRFTTTLLEEYEKRVAAAMTALGATATPTASAGVVFAHYKFPLATAVELAEQALRAAKDHFCATRSAVHWADVTVDGPVTDADRRPFSLADLTALRTPLDALAALPPSGRKRFEELHARARGRAPAGVYLNDLIRGQAARLGVLDAVTPFLAPGAPASLADALRILRWWS
jgi:hypothetical protein